MDTMNTMHKAIKNIRLLLGNQEATLYQTWFERTQIINNANRIFRRIASTKDMDQVRDYLAEIRYALIFAGLGFDLEFEPEGNQGPDLGITRDGQKAVVEITRFRKIHSGLPLGNLYDENLILNKYGNSPRDIRKASQKILNKFRQVKNQKGIIAIWNDDRDMEEIEIGPAVEDILADVKKCSSVLQNGLLFVLYGSDYIIHNKQLYCFPFPHIEQPYITWMAEIEMKLVPSHIQNAFLKAESIKS